MWRRVVLISIIVLILAIIVGAWFVYHQNNQVMANLAPQAGQVNEIPADDLPNGDTTSINTDTVNTPIVQKLVDPSKNLDAVVRLFVEKYGSYSTDYPYNNLRSVLNFVTDGYKSNLESTIEQGLDGISSETPFYSVSTRVLTIEKIEEKSNSAIIKVLTQRSESYSRIGSSIISYQNISLSLRFESDKWLVESAKWLSE